MEVAVTEPEFVDEPELPEPLVPEEYEPPTELPDSVALEAEPADVVEQYREVPEEDDYRD